MARRARSVADRRAALGRPARSSCNVLFCEATQEELAQRAGLSKRTVERLGKATSDVRLSAFVAACQALGLTEGFDALVPAVELGPLALARGERLPKRIRKTSRKANAIWGEPS